MFVSDHLFVCTVTMPIDVVKVRLQMQGADGTRQYQGMIDAGVKTARREGITALWKGLPPALVRQVSVYTALWRTEKGKDGGNRDVYVSRWDRNHLEKD